MINFTSRTAFYMRPEPTDMRNGRNGLAEIIRTAMGHDPYNYDEAFIFYGKDYRKIKMLHYDINGFVLYEKWFDGGRFLKLEFQAIRKSHRISRETLVLLMSASVQTKIMI